MAINLDNLQPYIVTPNPSDKIWLFYGETGTRKTSVACQFPQSLLLAFDIGYKFIDSGNFIPCPMQKWQEFKDVVKQLDKPTNKERFKTVIVDTIGMAYNACYAYMLTQMGVDDPGDYKGFGMGWRRIRNEFETVLRSICQKGYGLIMLAHSDEVEKEDKITKKKIQQIKIDIDKRPDLIIKQLADLVIYLNKEYKDEAQTQPTVFAYSNLVDIDTKKRPRFFAPRFEFTYENLVAELNKAVKAQYEANGKAMPEDVEQQNPYVAEKVNFDQLRSDTVELAKLLLSKGYEAQVNDKLIDIFKGTPLSELIENDENIDKLQIVYADFNDIKEKAKI